MLPVPVPLVVKRAALALDPPMLNVGDVSITSLKARRITKVVQLRGKRLREQVEARGVRANITRSSRNNIFEIIRRSREHFVIYCSEWLAHVTPSSREQYVRL